MAAPLCPENNQNLPPPLNAQIGVKDVDASADKVISENGKVVLDGSTVISFQGRNIRADNANYDSRTGVVEIGGDFNYSTPELKLNSTHAVVNINNDTLETGPSTYQLNPNGHTAQGRASRLERDKKGRIKLWDATYSACPPNDEVWNIKASKIRLDSDEGIGTAKNITLRFKGVPILYAPVFSFPINNKRKSGFLAPTFRQADNTGFELLVPWYWNISPNLDATFSPRYMSKWGVQVQGEFRYLNRVGDWRLDTEYLYQDSENRARRFTRFRHFGRPAKRWTSLIDASFVTDKDYFQDFGDNLNIASITHLDRRAEIRYQNSVNDFLVRLQRYQTVDKDIPSEKRPYLRLPQLIWNTRLPHSPYGLKTALGSEIVYFDRKDSVTGTRIDLHPTLSLPMNSDFWFLNPTAAWRYTYYKLDNINAANDIEISDSRITRNLPYASIDSGLFFDRSIGKNGSVQTFEPRLYYLRVPFEKQSNIPIFDSGQLDFNFSQLFRENRFSGRDRVADANQLTAAITTRFIHGPSGREQLRASIGQIFYYTDRRVFLDADGRDENGSSDIVGEVSAELKNDWVVKSGMQWNPYTSITVRSSFQLSYRPNSGKLFNMTHRRIEGKTEQVDFSAYWPINERWKLIGRWNYALDSDKSIESTLGLEYESCCWAFRFAARRYIADDGFDHDTNYFLELILKGLAPVGDNVGELLETGVLGYSDKYK